MPHVESRSAVIGNRIVLIGKKARLGCSSAGKEPTGASSRTCVAVSVVQNIKAEQRNSAPGIDPHICDQLVLAEYSAGGVLINILIGSIPTASSRENRRIDVIDVECVLAARVQVGHRHGRIFGDLTLDAGRALYGVWRPQIRRNLIHRRRSVG